MPVPVGAEAHFDAAEVDRRAAVPDVKVGGPGDGDSPRGCAGDHLVRRGRSDLDGDLCVGFEWIVVAGPAELLSGR